MPGTERPNFQISVEAEALIRLLVDCPVGSTIDYKAMNDACGVLVRDRKWIIATARNHMLNDHQAVFAAIRGVGLKRLTDSEIVASGDDHCRRIRRAAKRGIRQITCVSFEAMSTEDRARHNARLSVLTVMHSITRPTEAKKLESAAQQQRLSVDATLKHFLGQNPAGSPATPPA